MFLTYACHIHFVSIRLDFGLARAASIRRKGKLPRQKHAAQILTL